MQISDEMISRGAEALAKRNNSKSVEAFRGISAAVLEAALSAAEPSVAVKVLEWHDRHDIPLRANDLLAESVVGQFAIRPSSTGSSYRLFMPWAHYNDAKVFLSVEEAKAAAQADYEARIRSALTAQVQDVVGPEGWQLVPKDDESRCVADSALPHEMIEAGIRVQEQVNDDNCNYILGETTDWDCGMVAVAIYRAMLAAAPAKQEG